MPRRNPHVANLIGVTGEYYAAAELCRRGYLALLTPRNYPGVDILAQNPEDGRQVTIQVKTTLLGLRDNSWFRVPEQAQKHADFFIFVIVRRTPEPNYSVYIVPSEDVACMAKKRHDEYIEARPHVSRTQPYALSGEDLEPFRDNWQILF